MEHPGDVGSGKHPLDPLDRLGATGVDGHDVGTGMIRELERAVQQTLRPHVVDERAQTDRQFESLILHPAAADATRDHRLGDVARGQRLHSIEHLDVAGAAAQVPAEMP